MKDNYPDAAHKEEYLSFLVDVLKQTERKLQVKTCSMAVGYMFWLYQESCRIQGGGGVPNVRGAGLHIYIYTYVHTYIHIYI